MTEGIRLRGDNQYEEMFLRVVRKCCELNYQHCPIRCKTEKVEPFTDDEGALTQYKGHDGYCGEWFNRNYMPRVIQGEDRARYLAGKFRRMVSLRFHKANCQLVVSLENDSI